MNDTMSSGSTYHMYWHAGTPGGEPDITDTGEIVYPPPPVVVTTEDGPVVVDEEGEE